MDSDPDTNLATHTHLQLRWRLIAGFLLLYLLLQWGYAQTQGTLVEQWLIDKSTVQTSAFLINFLQGNELVQAQTHRLISPQVRISVLHGCEGIETMLLLIAAILVFTAPWRAKVLGIVLGIAIIFALNQMRIVALYFTALRHPEWFSALHGYIGPAIIIVLTGLYLWHWSRHLGNARP